MTNLFFQRLIFALAIFLGVILDKPVKQGGGSYCDVGLTFAGSTKEIRVDKTLKPGLRVTVKMLEKSGDYPRKFNPKTRKVHKNDGTVKSA